MATHLTYESLLASPDASPGWLLRPRGAAWMRASGARKDETLERMREAVQLRFLGSAPSDQLAATGWDRMVERAPAETREEYAARLVDAWNLWHFGGTPLGLLRALEDAGYPNAALAAETRRMFWLRSAVLTSRVGLASDGVVRHDGAAGADHLVGIYVDQVVDEDVDFAVSVGGEVVATDVSTYGNWHDLGGLDSRLQGARFVFDTLPAAGDFFAFEAGDPEKWSGLAAYELPAGSWSICPNHELWSKFQVLFTEHPWGKSGGAWLEPPAGRLNGLRHLVATWKSAISTCRRITDVRAGFVWGWPPGGVWAFGGARAPDWGSSTVVHYTP